MRPAPVLRARRTVITSVALAALTVPIAAGSVGAQATNAPTTVSNIVFVHGAWADGTAWSGEIELLQQEGYTVTAVQLPLTAIEDDVATVRRALEQQTGPTLLVAHSYGGAVLSALGTDAPNVVGEVFVSAFMLDAGESIQSLLGTETPPWLASLHPDSAGYLRWDEAGFLQYFAPDVDPARAAVLWAAQKPINAAILGTPSGVPSWKTLPTWYLVSDQDQIIPTAAQEQLAARAGSTVAHVAGSHASLVSHPEAVVDLIKQAIDSLGAGD